MRLSLPLVLFASLPFSACASAPEDDSAGGMLAKQVDGLHQEEQPDGIGYLLAEFDRRMSMWSSLKNEKRNEGDALKIKLLHEELRRKARKELGRLVRTLETDDARKNREVAAAALGFSDDPAVLSPLLAALADADNSVIQKALFGLGILASAETPTQQITYIMTSHPDPITRTNAAYALLRVTERGVRDEEIVADCRSALFDTEAGVRAQAAGILGVVKDADSVDALGDLLTDKVNLVAKAAASSLVNIGASESDQKAKVARLLVDAYERSSQRRRPWIRAQMAFLADQDLGPELSGWLDWAYRLP